VTPDGAVTLTFQAALGHTYRVEFKDDLALSAWAPLGPNVFATSTEVVINDPSPSPFQRFYRIVQVN
jgi:hypothetical protein